MIVTSFTLVDIQRKIICPREMEPASMLVIFKCILQHSYSISSVPVRINDELVRDYYVGFCKSYLWPLLHYNLNITFKQEEWDAYYTVNQLFANTIQEIYRPGDLVFIQDYHF